VAAELTDINAMTRKREDDKQPKKPAGRAARLAAALRENLRRRKTRERQRNAPGAEPISAHSRASGNPGRKD
jgi:hypothetical protein